METSIVSPYQKTPNNSLKFNNLLKEKFHIRNIALAQTKKNNQKRKYLK